MATTTTEVPVSVDGIPFGWLPKGTFIEVVSEGDYWTKVNVFPDESGGWREEAGIPRLGGVIPNYDKTGKKSYVQ